MSIKKWRLRKKEEKQRRKEAREKLLVLDNLRTNLSITAKNAAEMIIVGNAALRILIESKILLANGARGRGILRSAAPSAEEF